jgi:putative transcriptional regulator
LKTNNSKRTRDTSTSFGASIIQGLTEFKEALQSNKVIAERFTFHRVVLDLNPTPHDAKKVKATRMLLGASQAVFAQFLGVSARTIQAWEQGANTPNDMACRFMDEIRRDPKYWRDRLRALIMARRKRTKKKAQARNAVG